MKKIIFFALFIGCFSFVNAQSSQAIGLKLSYIGDNTLIPNASPEFGITYDFFLNEKHGIINELNLNLVTNNITFTHPGGNSIFTQKSRSNHVSYALNYIFKHNEWFVKSGFNIRFANATTFIIIDDIPVQETSFNDLIVKVYPEYHLGLGRDLDLGKINIRAAIFMDKALNARYMEYGASLCFIYDLSTTEVE